MILEAFRISGCLTTSRKSKHNKNRRGALVKRVVVEFSTRRIYSGILMHSPLRRVPPTTLSRSPPQKQIYLETSVLPTAILSYKIPRLEGLRTSLSSNRASQLNPTQSLSSKSSQCILIVRKRIYSGSARRRRRQIRSSTSLILEIFDSSHPSLILKNLAHLSFVINQFLINGFNQLSRLQYFNIKLNRRYLVQRLHKQWQLTKATGFGNSTSTRMLIFKHVSSSSGMT